MTLDGKTMFWTSFFLNCGLDNLGNNFVFKSKTFIISSGFKRHWTIFVLKTLSNPIKSKYQRKFGFEALNQAEKFQFHEKSKNIKKILDSIG